MTGEEKCSKPRSFEPILIRTIAILVVVLSIATWVTFAYVLGNRRVIENNTREITALKEELSYLNAMAAEMRKERKDERKNQ